MVTQKKNDVFDDIEVILDELMKSTESTDSNISNLYGNWSVGDIRNAKEAIKRQSALQFRSGLLGKVFVRNVVRVPRF